MDIFEIIMNAVDDFDEGFENVLQFLNEKIEAICPSDSIDEIEDNKEVNIIDISAEDVNKIDDN